MRPDCAWVTAISVISSRESRLPASRRPTCAGPRRSRRPPPAPHGLQHLEREAHAVLEAAAIAVAAVVDGGRPELVGRWLEAISSTPSRPPPGPAGTGGVGRDDAGDVLGLQLLGEGAVLQLADRRGGHGRQPVRHVPAGAPAHMGDLDHEGTAMGVDAGRELQDGDDAVVADVDLAEGRGLSGATVEEPPNMVSASPPLAFSS